MHQLADDPLCSDSVRRVAREQSYSEIECSSRRSVREAAKHLRENAELGRCVRELYLKELIFYTLKEGEKEEDENGDTGEQEQAQKWYRNPGVVVNTSILDILGVMPGLQRLICDMKGVAKISLERERQLTLNRLTHLYLRDECNTRLGSAALDLDDAIIQMAPNLQELGLDGTCEIVASKNTTNSPENAKTPRLRLEGLKRLQVFSGNLPLASLQCLMSNIGPGLRDLHAHVSKLSLRPSSNSDDSRRFGLYDLLVALAP